MSTPRRVVTSTGDRVHRQADGGPEFAAPSTSRKMTGMAIRGLGLAAGIAAVAVYFYLVWIASGDQPHDRPVRNAVGLLTIVPLLLLVGPLWLADRIAARIDRRRMVE